MKGGNLKEMAKEIPVGVKIIAVLYYIGAVLSAILGILSIVGAGFVASLIPALGALGAGIMIAVGILLIGLAVLWFFMGRGLWRAQPWARILVIIFAIIGVIMAIIQMITFGAISLVSNIISLIINAVIGWYMLFNAEVKKAFA